MAKEQGTLRPRAAWDRRVPFKPALAALLLLAPAGRGLAEEAAAAPAASGQLQLPYAFSSDAFGGAVGYVYGGTGILQPQATVLATAIIGTNSAYALYLLARDLRMPGSERLFIDTDLAVSHFGTIRSYINGNPSFQGQQAGSNDSSPDNYVEGSGDDNLVRANFRWLLPVGSGQKGLAGPPALEGGLPASGAAADLSWDPRRSGKTFLEAKPYWRSQTIDSGDRRYDQKTNGIAFSLYRDNTDFPRSPSRGSQLRLRHTRDWGLGDSSRPYAVNDAEFSKYFTLGATPTFRQRVLAFDAWTAQSPTWDQTSMRDGVEVNHRPPAYLGATLGGLWRMRGFQTSRFNDQAAIYYAMEYRVIPVWNPFDGVAWIKRNLGIAWWQWVAFAEAGRVAPAWSPDLLHRDMQWDAGLGIRAMAKGVVVRVDMAKSKEEFTVNMIVGQPFQF
jgi:hypothetical protein